MANLSVGYYQMPFKVPGKPADRKALHYFYVYASVDLTGYTWLGFWEDLVLKFCRSDTVVQQAVIALSRAHLELSERAKPKGLERNKASGLRPDQLRKRQVEPPTACRKSVSPVTLEAHQQAIRRLRNYMQKQSHPSYVVVLICCVLLSSFNALIGNLREADIHLSNGLQIFRSMSREKLTVPSGSMSVQSSASDIDAVLPVLARLDVDNAARFIDRGFQLTLSDGVSATDEGQRFSTLQDATVALTRIARVYWKLQLHAESLVKDKVFTAPKSVLHSHAQVIAMFGAWGISMEGFERLHPSINASSRLSPKTESKRDLLAAIGTQSLWTQYFVVKQMVVSCLDIFPFSARSRETQLAESTSVHLLAAARRALELQAAYKTACDLPRTPQVSMHWSIFETLEKFITISPEPENCATAVALLRDFGVS